MALTERVAEVFKYGVTGSFGLVVNLALLVAFVELLGWPALHSAVLSVFLTLFVTFVLLEKWVFQRLAFSGQSQRSNRLVVYYGVMLAGKAINFVLYAALLAVGVWYPVAWLLGAAVVFFGTFLINRTVWSGGFVSRLSTWIAEIRPLREQPAVWLLVAGGTLQLLTAPFVDLHLDTGFWLYDASLILDGQTPLIDYPGRFPLIHYVLAGTLYLGGNPLRTTQALMVVIFLVLSVFVYAFTRKLHSERAALSAMALCYLTPLVGVRAQYVLGNNAMAILVLASALLILRVIDEQDAHFAHFALAGVPLGAAFLIRQSAVVHIAAIALFVVYWGLRRHSAHRLVTIGQVFALGGGTTASILLGYALLAWPSPEQFWFLVRYRFLELFISQDVAPVGWYVNTNPESVQAGLGIGAVIRDWLVEHGIVSIGNVLYIVATGLPAIALLAVYARTALDALHPLVSRLFALGVVAVSLTTLTLTDSFVRRGPAGTAAVEPTLSPAILVLVSIVIVGYVWYIQMPRWRDLWTPKLLLPAMIVGSLLLSYLVRDAPILTSYFLDVFPFLVVFSAIALAETAKANSGTDNTRTSDEADSSENRPAVVVGACLLGIVIGVSVLATGGFTFNDEVVVGHPEITTHEDANAVATDLETRTSADDRVLTAEPLYVVQTDARQAGDLSRGFWEIDRTTNSPGSEHLEATVTTQIEQEEVSHVIMDHRTQHLLDRQPAIESAVSEHFCPVDDADTTKRYGAELWERSDDAPECS